MLLGLVGVPAALVGLGGNPLPATVTWDGIRDALLTRDDGTILVGLVTVVGWVAWLVFAVSVVSELVALLSGERIRLSLPGLAGPQRVAAGLLVSVIAMIAAPPLVPPPPMGTTDGRPPPTPVAEEQAPPPRHDAVGPRPAGRCSGHRPRGRTGR